MRPSPSSLGASMARTCQCTYAGARKEPNVLFITLMDEHGAPSTRKITLTERWKRKSCSRLLEHFVKHLNKTEGRQLELECLVVEEASGATLDLESPICDCLTNGQTLSLVRKTTTPREEEAPPAVEAAIVTTLKDSEARLGAFIQYHLAIGFSHIYLYFDDPSEEASIAIANSFSKKRVTITRSDDSLRQQWAELRGWDHMRLHLDDVQVRQMLNAQHALRRSRRRGLSWLLHIDSDELFFPGPRARSVHDHFATIPAPCSVLNYCNLEAVPEDLNTPPFRQTLFKNSLTRVPSTKEAREALAFWSLRSPRTNHFLFYENGKSAVRCSLDAVPVSVHMWCPVEKWRLKSLGWTNDARNEGLEAHPEVECSVLHYACTDPESLWQKYRTLGNFALECVGGAAVHDADTFHVHARDHYLRHARDADGGRHAMRELFERAIMLEHPQARAHARANDIARTLALTLLCTGGGAPSVDWCVRASDAAFAGPPRKVGTHFP